MNEHPEPLHEAHPPRTVPLSPADAVPSGDVVSLLYGGDLHLESLLLGRATVRRAGGLLAHMPRADARVRAADEQAMNDALARAVAHFGCEPSPALPGWKDCLPVVTA